MFKLEFETDNDAFADNEREETARILRSLAYVMANRSAAKGGIRDINGNTVGRWEFTP